MSKHTQYNRNKATWFETKKKTTWFEIRKDKTLTLYAYQQEHHKWRPPSEEEHGKRIIHGTSFS